MHHLELTTRLHEIGDTIDNRANEIERLARERRFPGEESINIGIGALRDDALLLHCTADAIEELGEADVTFVAVLAPAVDRLYEGRRKR